MSGIIVAPSVLSADFLHLEDEIKAVEKAGADWLHVDIMDGHFVPNLTFGPKLVKSIRGITRLPLDVHLMLDNPQTFIEKFISAGADNITVHSEVTVPVPQLFDMVKSHFKSFGLSIKPDTPLESVSDYLDMIDILLIMTVYPGFGGQEYIESVTAKIAEAARLKADNDYHFAIEVDGGLNERTVMTAVSGGATIIVAGEYIFGSRDYRAAINSLRVG
ncbi:MAG: ribulose-phosphate 3-epimerase [candidate division Zixibacteria bacterium RBG_16_53_22]|nr:MAG: ribulose-phosphate 3-epimerase [candidate division Zixibacteria bacterium RBG_16_53_22]